MDDQTTQPLTPGEYVKLRDQLALQLAAFYHGDDLGTVRLQAEHLLSSGLVPLATIRGRLAEVEAVLAETVPSEPRAWEPGEDIEPGVEVEYVGGYAAGETPSMVGRRVKVLLLDEPTNAVIEEIDGKGGLQTSGVYPQNLRRIS